MPPDYNPIPENPSTPPASSVSQGIFKVLVARVRIKTHAELKEIAHRETDRSGRQIYVADLVREAIRSYIRHHRSTKFNLDGSET